MKYEFNCLKLITYIMFVIKSLKLYKIIYNILHRNVFLLISSKNWTFGKKFNDFLSLALNLYYIYVK